MIVDDAETTNGHGCDLNCSLAAKTESIVCDKVGFLLDGGSGSVSFGEGTSAEGLRIYKRRKRRKMSNPDEMTNTNSGFCDKIKAVDGGTCDQDDPRLSLDPSTVGGGECFVMPCRKVELQQKYQSLNGLEDGPGECIQNAHMTDAEGGCSSLIKGSLDSVERSENKTHNSAKENSHATSTVLLKQSEGSTISELCGHAFSDILNSDKFSELCGLLLKDFGVVDVNRVLDVNAIKLKMKNGAYETSPMLYLKDIQQVWTKLQQVGSEMVTLARSLSDKSKAHYEQLIRKARAADGRVISNCKGCGEKADVRNCLVCDSCEEIYHLNCTELVVGGSAIPPKSWYCANCVSNGIGSPHDNCIVCEKLKTAPPAPPISPVDELLLTEQDLPNGLEADMQGESKISKICYVCKTKVKIGDNFRTCGHALCPHKFYHYECLTSKQLGVCGPCWYCPSCLCRRCLVDKDDDQIILCDSCDHAYHIYCTTPQLLSIPIGTWFCAKCDRELKRLRTMKIVYENIQKKVKLEDVSEKESVAVVEENEERNKSGGGLDMLVNAAKTLRDFGYP